MPSSTQTFKRNDYQPDDILLIAASEIVPGQKIIVKSTHQHILEMIETMWLEPLETRQRIFRKALSALLKVDYEAMFSRLRTMEHPMQDTEWSNVCEDISIVAVARYVLFKAPIPIVKDNGDLPKDDFTH